MFVNGLCFGVLVCICVRNNLQNVFLSACISELVGALSVSKYGCLR